MRFAETVSAVVVLAATPATAMSLMSGDLKPNAPMPAKHIYPRCGGENVSPQLSWRDAPQKTSSYVVTMIDQDVKPSKWSHWIIVGLRPTATSLPQGMREAPPGASVITSNFGDASYAGPCPPEGSGLHHYQITVWAISGPVPNIAPDAPARAVESMLAQRSLDRASITVTVMG